MTAAMLIIYKNGCLGMLKRKIHSIHFKRLMFQPHICLVVIMVLCALAAVISLIFPKSGHVFVVLNSDKTLVISDLFDGHELSVSFLCEHDQINSVSLQAATYTHALTQGEVQFILGDETRDLRNGAIQASSIADNQLLMFHFEPIDLSRNTKLTLTITTSGIPEAGRLTFWANDHQTDLLTTAYDNQDLDIALIMQYGYAKDIYPYSFDLILLCVIFALLLVVAYPSSVLPATGLPEMGKGNKDV